MCYEDTKELKFTISHPRLEGMAFVPCYGRWTKAFELSQDIKQVCFVRPDGIEERMPVFRHQPGALAYDVHGYETVLPVGNEVLAVRYTPDTPGKYTYAAMRGDQVIESGAFSATPSKDPGYVEVSKRDSRYFAFSDGSSYCPIGLNLCWPKGYRLPAGSSHFKTIGSSATMGVWEYKRWMTALSENGGNFIRIWLSNGYFSVEGQAAGDLDLLSFNKLDGVIETARELNIKLKLCFEHFRTTAPDTIFSKTIRHPEDGTEPMDIQAWFTDPKWQDLWLIKIKAYMARYANDPVIMAWELWNEINCCETGDFGVQRTWTREMLKTLKTMAPKQMAVNSLGSFDHEGMMAPYEDFCMEEMDFQQVHRYLDQGASLKVCRKDPPTFSMDAVMCTRRPDRPILLAETGGVNDHHTGPFRYYRFDNRGIIFHDTTFPAFFAGAAGTGQCWHWDEYVDEKNLWTYFEPFSKMVDKIQLDAEEFRVVDLSTEKIWVYALLGKTVQLCWIRNKADTWYRVYRDGTEPATVWDMQIPLKALGIEKGHVTTYWPWQEDKEKAHIDGDKLSLPPFRYGLMLRIEKENK